jgi:hypothetical protein
LEKRRIKGVRYIFWGNLGTPYYFPILNACLRNSILRSYYSAKYATKHETTKDEQTFRFHLFRCAKQGFCSTIISKSSSNYNNPLMAKLRVYPDKSGSNQYQMRHLNPPDLSTGRLVDERRINMGNPGLNFLIRQDKFVPIFLRVICAICGSISFIFSLCSRSLPATPYGGFTRHCLGGLSVAKTKSVLICAICGYFCAFCDKNNLC